MAIIQGTAAADSLTGTAGTELILARGGDDRVVGRAGDDVILGGAGADTIDGDNDGPDFGPLPATGPGGPQPLDLHNLILAGGGDDPVRAGFGADTVLGGGGDDTLIGYGLFGGSPSATGLFIDADGPDLLLGGAGRDELRGGGGRDVLLGGHGDDTVVGGTGADTLSGGPGRDHFLFGRGLEPFAFDLGIDTGSGPGTRDLVLDFRQGRDVLDLSGLRNFLGGPDLPPPRFLGTDPFVASNALQVRYDIEEGDTVVRFLAPLGTPEPGTPPAVPEGPGGEIELAGVHHLRASDFILP
ncbi:calcium-binding protein [Dankookia sp. GCM10030260]|uniref:calcium-binding protein n=1 Tax=Dankookia sp. GCM10030260 TaxID=3273390 RepID=UPI003609D5EB